METVFDHNVRNDELSLLGHLESFEENKKEVLEIRDQDSHYRMISDLYKVRKDYEKAHQTSDKIQDPERRDKVMETVFDHDITDEEFTRIYGSLSLKRKIKERQDQDSHFWYISDLYVLRKDDLKSYDYAKKIKDPSSQKGRLQEIYNNKKGIA